ncbi:MAG: hypothetical protein PHX21_04025 [bacterium]|nr:hypothetical protein [bacterium]
MMRIKITFFILFVIFVKRDTYAASETSEDKLSNYKSPETLIVKNIKNVSLEVFGGQYFTFDRDTMYIGNTTYSYMKLPFYLWKTGGKISYAPNHNLIFSIAGDYSYIRNLPGHYIIITDISYHYDFNLIHFSFLCSYRKDFFRYGQYYLGGGISSFKTYSCVGRTESAYLYVDPTITAGLDLGISPSFYIGIQSEASFSHIVNDNSYDYNPPFFKEGEILPSLTISLGYRFTVIN